MTDVTLAKTPAAISAAIIIDALIDARDNAVTPETINALDRAILVAQESGVLVTQTGEPVVDILDEMYHAMPAPATNKLSVPWRRALPNVHRPRYRIAGIDKPGCPVVLTDTTTGVQRIWNAGEAADNMREAFKMTDCGAGVTGWGIGVCGRNEELAQELIERGA